MKRNENLFSCEIVKIKVFFLYVKVLIKRLDSNRYIFSNKCMSQLVHQRWRESEIYSVNNSFSFKVIIIWQQYSVENDEDFFKYTKLSFFFIYLLRFVFVHDTVLKFMHGWLSNKNKGIRHEVKLKWKEYFSIVFVFCWSNCGCVAMNRFKAKISNFTDNEFS